MFDFLKDALNYDERCVGRYEGPDGFTLVSTARISDGSKPFETAWQHPEYNGGEIVVVEAYDSKVEAAAGHASWVKLMKDGPLPDIISDCCNADCAKKAFSNSPRTFRRKVPKTTSKSIDKSSTG